MFLASSHFSLSAPLTDGDVDRVAKEVVEAVFARSPGFQSYYAVQASEKETLAVSIWDDESSYLKALEAATPVLQKIVGSKLMGPPQRTMGPIRYQISK